MQALILTNFPPNSTLGSQEWEREWGCAQKPGPGNKF